MHAPWRNFYAAADVRELDRRAIHDHGIPGYTLMRRAARAAWEHARQAWGRPEHVVVFCGTGNNGGDGYEIARLAQNEGIATELRELPGTRRGDAAQARTAWLEDSGGVAAVDVPVTVAPEQDCWVVDALLGTGMSRAPEGASAQAIEAINAARTAGARVLAVDVPSGLPSDTGAPPGAVVLADCTVTFIGDKPGLHTGRGIDHAGAVHCAPLGVPAAVYDGIAPLAVPLDMNELSGWFPPRVRSAHKNRHGHVLVVGGAPGMAGAALLAGRAALRAGAGLVSVATHPAHAAALCAAQPELMVHGITDAEALAPLLQRASAVALGPGLGRADWSRALFRAVCAAASGRGLPLVIDADALHLLAESPDVPAAVVLTPHPGEAAQLLGITAAEVEADRIAAARALHRRLGAVAVLKGAGTLVAAGDDPPALCTAGNPGMACGGSGDVLTGVIAACAAQGMEPGLAARAGVLAHAAAGDRAARDGERGMLPGDLIAALRTVVNPVGARA